MVLQGKRAEQGSPLAISAKTWNVLTEVAREYKRGMLRNSMAGQSQQFQTSSIELYIKNDSGVDLDRFGILGVDGVLYNYSEDKNEFLNRHTLVGKKVNGHETVAVVQEPVKNGKFARCIIEGITPAKVYLVSVNDTHCFAADNSYASFNSATSGPNQIISKPIAPKEREQNWCLVRLGTSGGGGSVVHKVLCQVRQDFSLLASDFNVGVLSYIGPFYGPIFDNGYNPLGLTFGEELTIRNPGSFSGPGQSQWRGIFEGAIGDLVIAELSWDKAVMPRGVWVCIQKGCTQHDPFPEAGSGTGGGTGGTGGTGGGTGGTVPDGDGGDGGGGGLPGGGG